MLSARATPKTIVGRTRVNPAERPRASAHTDSMTPDSSRTTQAMTTTPSYGRLVRPGTTRPRPGPPQSRRSSRRYTALPSQAMKSRLRALVRAVGGVYRATGLGAALLAAGVLLFTP